jgi:high-affinity Fe2+/Pb2+ permease
MRKILAILYNVLVVNGDDEPTNMELGLFIGVLLLVVAFLFYLFS